MINLIHKITIHPRKNFLVVNNLAKWHQLLICTAINRTAINLTGKFRPVKHMNGKMMDTFAIFVHIFPSKFLWIRYTPFNQKCSK